MNEKDLQHGAQTASDENQDDFEDDAAEGAASLIGMRIRRRSRRGAGQGFANQQRPNQAGAAGQQSAAPARMARPIAQPPAPPSINPLEMARLIPAATSGQPDPVCRKMKNWNTRTASSAPIGSLTIPSHFRYDAVRRLRPA